MNVRVILAIVYCACLVPAPTVFAGDAQRPTDPLAAPLVLADEERASAEIELADETVAAVSAPGAGTLQEAASRASIQVSRIELLNNTVLPEQDLRSLIGRYENRAVSSEELQELRFLLSQAYVDKGFVNSGVFIPDQKVENGEIRLAAIEGKLTGIRVEGNRRLRDRYFSTRIEDEIASVLNVFELQNSLQRIQQDPLVRQVNAQLIPGLRPGESELLLQVREHSPYYLGLRADNHRATSVGEERARLTFAHRNLTGHHDALTVEIGNTEGVQDGFVRYNVPLSAKDTLLEAYYAADDTEIIERPFSELDIQTDTRTWGVNLTHPFIRRPNTTVQVTVGFYNKRSESTLLGVPFSFNPGDERGGSEVSVVPVSVEWTGRQPNEAYSLRGSVRIGVDALDSTINSNTPDSEFSAFLGQLQYVRRFDWRQTEINLRSTFQLAGDTLLAVEKFSVGGARTVRGYRENQLVRDNGVLASLEARIPLSKDPTFRSLTNFRLVPFIDYGRSWDKDNRLSTSKAENIYSVGLGLTWEPTAVLHAELYYGHALEDLKNANDGLQNRGWHFLLNLNVPFGRGQ